MNLTQALADEWAVDGIRVNCVNPERTATPMRLGAFGEEPADSLLTSRTVAEIAVDVLIVELDGRRRRRAARGRRLAAARMVLTGGAPVPGVPAPRYGP